jgi:hypothetical protein
MRGVFWLMTFVWFGSLLFVGDVLVGWATDSSELRIAARQFREEAAHLLIPTKNLAPDVDHVFAHRGDDGARITRRFRTNREGIVVNGNDVSSANRKILFLGGSTTECNEVLETLRFPSVVERSLREAHIDVITYNAGVRSHTTQDAINSLLNRAEFRSADVIVLMENINDRLRLGIQGSYDSRLGSDAPASNAALVGSLSGFWDAIVDYVAYRSNSAFLLRHLANKHWAWTGDSHAVEVTERSIDLLSK